MVPVFYFQTPNHWFINWKTAPGRGKVRDITGVQLASSHQTGSTFSPLGCFLLKRMLCVWQQHCECAFQSWVALVFIHLLCNYPWRGLYLEWIVMGINFILKEHGPGELTANTPAPQAFSPPFHPTTDCRDVSSYFVVTGHKEEELL